MSESTTSSHNSGNNSPPPELTTFPSFTVTLRSFVAGSQLRSIVPDQIITSTTPFQSSSSSSPKRPALTPGESPARIMTSEPKSVSNPSSPWPGRQPPPPTTSPRKTIRQQQSNEHSDLSRIASTTTTSKHWLQQLLYWWDVLSRQSVKMMIRCVWVYCMILVVIASIAISQHDHDLHEHESHGFEQQSTRTALQLVLLASFVIAIPMVIDVLLSFTLPQVVKDREFGRVYVLIDVLLPNLLMLLHVVGPNVLDLVLFYQFMHILMVVLHRIYTYSTLLNVPQLSSTAFREVYVIMCVQCFLAFCYQLAVHGLLDGQDIWRAVFTAGLVLLLAWIAFKLRHWFRLASFTHNIHGGAGEKVGHAPSKVFYYVLFSHVTSQLLVGSAQLWLYPWDVLFFSQQGFTIVCFEVYFICLIVMISATKNYEVRRGEHSHRVELEYNRKMTRTISHEIRTPLNTAFMALELLLDTIHESAQPPNQQHLRNRLSTAPEGTTAMLVLDIEQGGGSMLHTSSSTAPEVRLPQHQVLEMVDTIKEACNISLSIVNQLLTFDKLRSGMMQLEPGLLSVLQLVDSNVLLFRMQAQQLGIHLMVFMGQEDRDRFANMFVFVDEHKINQVIRNLLSNAMKFTPKNGTVAIQVIFSPLDVLKLTAMTNTSNEPAPSSSSWLDSFNCGRQLGKKHKVMAAATSMSFSSHISLHRQQSPLVTNPNAVAPTTPSLCHQEVLGAKAYGFVTFSIIDSGPGVSAEDQKKLFQEYVQISPGELQKGQGTGLGLSISKAIVQLHGGNIAMTSEGRGKGSTFFIELPAYQKTEAPKSFLHLDNNSDAVSFNSRGRASSVSMRSSRVSPTKSHSGSTSIRKPLDVNASAALPPSADSSLHGGAVNWEEDSVQSLNHVLRPLVANQSRLIAVKSFQILIVDDSATNRKMLHRLLAREGHVCVEADDGQTAIETMIDRLQAQTHDIIMPDWRVESEGDDASEVKPFHGDELHNHNKQIDIILMDYFMKEVHGPEAAQRIREMGFNGPIIGITGLMDEDSHDFIHAGADVVLCKPVTVQAIWKALRTLDFFGQDAE